MNVQSCHMTYGSPRAGVKAAAAAARATITLDIDMYILWARMRIGGGDVCGRKLV